MMIIWILQENLKYGDFLEGTIWNKNISQTHSLVC